jgi:hypothetical protein
LPSLSQSKEEHNDEEVEIEYVRVYKNFVAQVEQNLIKKVLKGFLGLEIQEK